MFSKPRLGHDELYNLVLKNTGRTLRDDEDIPTVFVYHEWPEFDEIEANTIPEVKVVLSDGEEPWPMECGVCKWCASDMELSDGQVIVCTTCGAHHGIP